MNIAFNDLNKYKKTLSEISFDRANNEFLTESSFKAIDFDQVKDDFCKTYYSRYLPESTMRSTDALIILDNNVNERYILIEFKNGDISKKLEKEKIRTKIAESLLIFNEIFNKNLEFDRKKLEFILVYNKTKNPTFENNKNSSLTKIATIIGKSAKEEYIIDGFDRYKAFFCDVKTVNEEEFIKILDILEKYQY